MSTEEAEKVQAIVAEGVAREGLEEIVLPAEEAAAKRLADLVSDAAIDRMIADAQEAGVSLLDGPGGLIGQLTARVIERALGATPETLGVCDRLGCCCLYVLHLSLKVSAVAAGRFEMFGGCGGALISTVPEDLALAEVAWLTDRLLIHGHLIPNGPVVLLRAFQRALQEPDDSVLGLADIRRARSPGPAGLPDGRTVVRAIHDCGLPCPRVVIIAAGPRLDSEGIEGRVVARTGPPRLLLSPAFTLGGGMAPRSARRPDRVSPRRRVLQPR